MNESPGMENKPSPINKYTPKNMLSFSKQIGRGDNKQPRDDVSPTIKNRPRVEKLHTHLN